MRSLQRFLSEDELARASRFCLQGDRDQFVVARGMLRVILGRYRGLEPSCLRFGRGPHGKPFLVGEASPDDLHFNLAHTRGLALYAVTRGREVGIDLEGVRSDFACDEVAERFFSPGEIAALRALPSDARDRAFFACWTRKEAYVKARGEGLMLPLDQFDVSLAPGEPATLLSTRWDPQEASRWSLQDLAPGPGYVAALAVEGHRWRLDGWQWPEQGELARSGLNLLSPPS